MCVKTFNAVKYKKKYRRALGLGATRGRIYMKHPELFKVYLNNN